MFRSAEQARAAALVRWQPDSPEAEEARRELAFGNLCREIEKRVAQAPPFTDEQRAQLAALLAVQP